MNKIKKYAYLIIVLITTYTLGLYTTTLILGNPIPIYWWMITILLGSRYFYLFDKETEKRENDE